MDSAYKILEINSDATDSELKKAYRKMAVKYHPDKVQHLGRDFQQMAEDKFKILNLPPPFTNFSDRFIHAQNLIKPYNKSFEIYGI